MIYVDEIFQAIPRTAQARRHGRSWCHMFCDGDLEELHVMAEKLGLRRQYFQPVSFPHYDLIPAKRALAVQYGATELTIQEMARKIQELRIKAREKQKGA